MSAEEKLDNARRAFMHMSEELGVSRDMLGVLWDGVLAGRFNTEYHVSNYEEFKS